MAGPLSNIQQLKENQEKGLVNCLERITELETLNGDYHALKSRLETISDKLTHNVMVPMGNVAFMPGHLNHTNEILVLLGDNWFAERTAKQAVGITERRIQSCQKLLNDLEKEKQQYSDWMKYVSEVQGNDDFVEVIEEYDPVKEQAWNEQHKQYVRNRRATTNPETLVEDPIRKLDRLQLQDTRMGSQEKSNNRTDSSNDEIPTGSKTRLVKWQDEVERHHMQINFSHTNAVTSQDNEEQDEDVCIQSPADIYKQFLPETQDGLPKSILKNKSVQPNDSAVTPPERPAERHNDLTSEEDLIQAFTGEVIERPVSVSGLTNEASSRPASRFKARRQNM